MPLQQLIICADDVMLMWVLFSRVGRSDLLQKYTLLRHAIYN